MTRPLLIIASRHGSVASALGQYLAALLPRMRIPHRVERIEFSTSAELLEALDRLKPEQLLSTMLVFDLASESGGVWDVRSVGGENGIAVQLILSYPEIYIAFLGTSFGLDRTEVEIDGLSWESIVRHHFVRTDEVIHLLSLVQQHVQGFRTLFDATGLRSALKCKLQELRATENDEQWGRAYAPLSESRIRHVAASADEEGDFVYLNGYAAYRAGCSAWLLSTQAEFWRALPRKDTATPHPMSQGRKFDVVLSDWQLAYQDQEEPLPTNSSLLEKVRFESSDSLIIITGFEPKKICDKQYWMTKPYGGIFRLLDGPEYKDGYPLRKIYERGKSEVREQSGLEARQKITNHSAPYSRSVIATRLLARARLIKHSGLQNTETWVQMALLAGEAKEILGGLSRTTAFEAVALQHEAEVCAEVSFFGTSTDIEVKERLKLLEQEGKVIEGTTGTDTIKPSCLNFLLQTTNNLRLRFTEYEQISAAEDCLRKFAEVERKLQKGAYRKIASRLGWWYLDKATDAGTSVIRLLMVSLGIVALFALIYFVLLNIHPMASQQRSDRLSLAVRHSFYTFVELQPGAAEIEELKRIEYPPEGMLLTSDRWRRTYHILSFIELLFAYVNLGLLISLLYRRITKRAP
jgi:hypothetical protein